LPRNFLYTESIYSLWWIVENNQWVWSENLELCSREEVVPSAYMQSESEFRFGQSRIGPHTFCGRVQATLASPCHTRFHGVNKKNFSYFLARSCDRASFRTCLFFYTCFFFIKKLNRWSIAVTNKLVDLEENLAPSISAFLFLKKPSVPDLSTNLQDHAGLFHNLCMSRLGLPRLGWIHI
jgi:hypothetical protein